MDTPMLKVFAERLRAHLEQHQLHLKHGQALDLIAALPGLRNWPEVNAFPVRVAAAQVNGESAERRARRLADAHNVTLTAAALVQVLEPAAPALSLKIWSDGPVPGVYVTTSRDAVDAAIEPSVGSKGDSYDNALAETINGLYKAELIHRRAPWKTRESVEFAALEWVSWFNHQRLLEPIGYIPPAQAEANYYRQLASQTTAVAA